MKNSSQETKEQYLTFSLGCETFALDIVKVREVLTLTKISQIPRAPGFMRGVISPSRACRACRGHAIQIKHAAC